MLRIPHQAGPTDFVVVRPFQAGDLRLSPRALARFADETQRCARFARLLRYLRAHRELLDVARGPQHDANPDQIVHDRRGAHAVRSTAAHVADQRRRGEFQCVYLADSVSLEELEMTLLASLPFGNRLEGLDVPADERCQRDGVVLPAAWHSLVFELHFAVLGPACGSRTLRKSPVLLLD